MSQAAQVCRNAANAVVSCATGPVRRAELRPAGLVHPAGQKYVVAIGAGVLDTAGRAAVARSSSAVRASTIEQEGSLSGAGTWSTTATTTAQASGGSYIRSNQAGTLAEYVFTGSSVTWTTVKGPLFGKVDLFVDGVRKVTGLNLYAATTTYKVNRTITGLTNAKHTLRVVALGQRGSTAVPITSSFVASDAVKGSGSAAVLQLPTRAWRTVPLTAALAGSYSSSSAVGTTYTFRFRGTAVAWKTLTSSAMGTASVTIDGVARPTLSNASTSATPARKSVSYAGLRDALHTLVIKVASKTVAVDGFTVS